MHLKQLPDFTQVLNSTRKSPTKDYYFSKYIPFSTIYLRLEQNLNIRNYPRQELILEIFVLATNHDMNMHAKIYEHAHIFLEKYYKILLCEILYNALLSNKQ
jgi:hypothetical protein